MTKIQRLVNRCDDINRDAETDYQELREAYSELGEFLYKKALEKKEYSVMIANPRTVGNKRFSEVRKKDRGT
ncbi:MAG: hypothetical protein HFH36_13350 [Lachnospiraceae bacterium]|nr:hypothetical protein [Lachnospiraceae bacterium]